MYIKVHTNEIAYAIQVNNLRYLFQLDRMMGQDKLYTKS